MSKDASDKEIWTPRRHDYFLLRWGSVKKWHSIRDLEDLGRLRKGYSMQRKWGLHTEQTTRKQAG